MTCSYGQWVGQKPYCDPGEVHAFHTQLCDAFSLSYVIVWVLNQSK